MLETVDGKRISKVAHADAFERLLNQLGTERAALFFGQFVWECIMNREEHWLFWDPNIDPSHPNREITGKVYFERGS